MATVDQLVIELSARTGKLESSLKTVERSLSQAAQSVSKSQSKIRSETEKTTAVISAKSSIIAGAFAGVGFAALNMATNAAKAIPMAADKVNMLQQRISLFSKDAAEAQTTYQSLLDIANRTGTELEPAVQLYTRLAATLGQAGYQTGEILRITETFSKTLRISGASSAEAASATLQFAQAMGSGVLRGEELNALLESNSAFALRLATSLGVPIGQLRQLGEQGALTSEIVAAAMRDMATEVDTTSEKLGVGLSGSLAAAGNSALDLADAVNDATGFTNILASAAKGAAEWFAEAAKSIRDVGVGRSLLSTTFVGDAVNAGMSITGKGRSGLNNPNASYVMPSEDPQVSTGIIPLPRPKTGAELLQERLASLKTTKPKSSAVATRKAEAAAARAAAEEYQFLGDTIATVADETEKANDVSREIGLTFESAFEDAIASGGKLSDVLQGLAQDLLKLTIRQNITRPLFDAFNGFDFGSLFGGGSGISGGYDMTGGFSAGDTATLAGLPSFAVGANNIPNDMVANIHKGEMIIPAYDAEKIRSGGGIGSDKSGDIVVNVINNNNSKVDIAQRQTSGGGVTLDVSLDDMMAKNIATAGTRTNQALQTFSNRSITKR